MLFPKKIRNLATRPIAFIKCEGRMLSEEHLLNVLQADLPRFKIPSHFIPGRRI